jgi:hypothetical protein
MDAEETDLVNREKLCTETVESISKRSDDLCKYCNELDSRREAMNQRETALGIKNNVNLNDELRLIEREHDLHKRERMLILRAKCV